MSPRFPTALVLGLAIALSSVTALSARTANLPLKLAEDDRVVFLTGKGEIFLDQEVNDVGNVQNSELRFLGIGENNEEGVPAGLYLFDGRTAKARIDMPDADQCSAVILSPDNNILAVDSGTSAIRTWKFFQYPGLKQIGEPVSYCSGKLNLAWLENNDILITYPDGEERICQSEVCAPLSVGVYTIATGRTKPLFKSTDRCDYTLENYADGTVTAGELCLKDREAWKDFMGSKEPVPVKKQLP